MKHTGVKIGGGFKSKDGKLEKIAGFGVPKYAQIAKRNKSKTPRVTSRAKAESAGTK